MLFQLCPSPRSDPAQNNRVSQRAHLDSDHDALYSTILHRKWKLNLRGVVCGIDDPVMGAMFHKCSVDHESSCNSNTPLARRTHAGIACYSCGPPILHWTPRLNLRGVVCGTDDLVMGAMFHKCSVDHESCCNSDTSLARRADTGIAYYSGGHPHLLFVRHYSTTRWNPCDNCNLAQRNWQKLLERLSMWRHLQTLGLYCSRKSRTSWNSQQSLQQWFTIVLFYQHCHTLPTFVPCVRIPSVS